MKRKQQILYGLLALVILYIIYLLYSINKNLGIQNFNVGSQRGWHPGASAPGPPGRVHQPINFVQTGNDPRRPGAGGLGGVAAGRAGSGGGAPSAEATAALHAQQQRGAQIRAGSPPVPTASAPSPVPTASAPPPANR
jgi:hypothetical protein